MIAGLGKAARLNSNVIRTIAVVIIAFLPPTFIWVSPVTKQESQ